MPLLIVIVTFFGIAIFCDAWLTREDCRLGIPAACAKIAATYEAKP